MSSVLPILSLFESIITIAISSAKKNVIPTNQSSKLLSPYTWNTLDMLSEVPPKKRPKSNSDITGLLLLSPSILWSGMFITENATRTNKIAHISIDEGRSPKNRIERRVGTITPRRAKVDWSIAPFLFTFIWFNHRHIESCCWSPSAQCRLCACNHKFSILAKMEEKTMMMKIAGIIIGIIILFEGIYYLIKEKSDPDSRKIYTIIAIIGAAITAIATALLIV